jgi:hypothetical protein
MGTFSVPSVKADYFYNIANQHGFHEEWELSVLNSKKTNK